MGKEIHKIIGCPEGLQFEFELAGHNLREGLAWGEGRLLILGEPVWVTEDTAGNEQPVEWSWLDLLEFLAESWPWLMLEENYPIPINPADMNTMKSSAKRRWEGLSEAIVDDEDEELVRFLNRHDLSLALKGIYLPSILLLRQGGLFQVGVPDWDQVFFFPFVQVKEVLEDLGEWIAGLVEGSEDPRAERAVFLWLQRRDRVREWEIRLCTDMRTEELEKLLQGQSAEDFFEMTGANPENGSELSLAARMAPGGLGIEGKKQVIEAVRRLPLRKTPELDGLSRKVQAMPLDTGSRSFEQGYALAGWLRGQLGYVGDAVPDPEGILTSWGVLLGEVTLPQTTEKLEAIAAWGPLHGPAVLVNATLGGRGVHEHRRRTSLAHEICHLLVDRSGGLPLLEVLGGRTPEIMEQRARAFAAEFLLPRSVAADAVRSGSDMKDVVSRLSEKYNLSCELVAWQITNSEAYGMLTGEEKGILEAARTASM